MKIRNEKRKEIVDIRGKDDIVISDNITLEEAKKVILELASLYLSSARYPGVIKSMSLKPDPRQAHAGDERQAKPL